MKILKDLLQVKKLIAILLTLAFIYLSIANRISSEFITIYMSVVAFYFGQSSVRDTLKDNNSNKRNIEG